MYYGLKVFDIPTGKVQLGRKILVGWGSLKFQGPMRACDLTINRWLVLFNERFFQDLETERIIVCIYDFCIVNQDFSCEFSTMSCGQVRFVSA